MRATPAPVAEPSIQRVSTVELFFDLVFVFAITQLTSLVAHPHVPADYLQGLLVFLTLMWIYAGYTWLTSNLALIVALGESIVAVGVGARELPLTVPLVLMAILALLLSTAVWWTYFDRDDRRAEHQFMLATPVERARMALLGFGYAHFAMIAGIILLAAGLEVGVAHPTGPPEGIGLWNLAAGLAVYLVGDTAYRRVLRIGPGRLRLLIAALAFDTVPLGFAFGALAPVAACVLLLQPLWIIDRAQEKRAGHGGVGHGDGQSVA